MVRWGRGRGETGPQRRRASAGALRDNKTGALRNGERPLYA